MGCRRRANLCHEFSSQRMGEVGSCLVSGGEAHFVARLGQFLRIVGHLLAEERAIMAACEADETWRALRR